jgi:hypothetical protein
VTILKATVSFSLKEFGTIERFLIVFSCENPTVGRQINSIKNIFFIMIFKGLKP